MRYQVHQTTVDGYDAVQLIDHQTGMQAVVVPELGNNAVSLTVDGKEFLWKPDESLQSLHARRALFGIPFLSPWANRLDQDGFWVDGCQFLVNKKLGNVREDAYYQPIHGLLLFRSWQVKNTEADDSGAQVTSTFCLTPYPELMAQFPFAHRLEMTHRLSQGRLSVNVRIFNECAAAIPVSVGFHPFFTLPEVPRDEWMVEIAARKHHCLNGRKIPDGTYEELAGGRMVDLSTTELDDVFSDLVRDETDESKFRVLTDSHSLTVGMGPNYRVSVVYAPQASSFVCIEPMAALTNAFNLAHAGLYDGLQAIAPEKSWEETFWVEPVLVRS
jgi:aldose 1-epimerase